METVRLILLTGPNEKPVWVSTIAIAFIRDDGSGGSIIEFRQGLSLAVQEGVEQISNTINNA